MTQQLLVKIAQDINVQQCDKRDCTARSLVGVRFPSGTWLFFCGHDFDRNEAAITQAALEIFDTRGLAGVIS
jgi:hypothetical protein